MSRYIYFGVGRSFGYMDQQMSSQVRAQVKPKVKKRTGRLMNRCLCGYVDE